MAEKKKPLKPGDLSGDKNEWAGIEFSKNDSGLLLPADMECFCAGPTGSFWGQPLQACAGEWPKAEGQISMADINSLAKQMARQMHDDSMKGIEQDILRSHHGSRMEYVWSETLKAHVQIGELWTQKQS